MTISVQTNAPGMAALQNLTATNPAPEEAQTNAPATPAAADANGSSYTLALSQRLNVSSLQAVTESLNRANAIADVTSAAGQTISDLLGQMREKAVDAMDASLGTAARGALNQDFTAILQQVAKSVQGASFNGVNLIDGSQQTGLSFIASIDASSSLTLSVRTMSLGGPILTLPSGAQLGSASSAASVVSMLDTSIANVDASLGVLSVQQKQIEGHLSLVSRLEGAVQGGVADTDVSTEGARLQALQVQQLLGGQTLSIANQAPQQILSLFKTS
jgi:flagellin